MSGLLVIRNRQRFRKVNLPWLREVCRQLVEVELARTDYDLGVFLVGETAMAELNQKHLGHVGSTDVITFDYGEGPPGGRIMGEIFVCVPVAVRQAREFGATWPHEVVRYIVHGVLHLLGHDDHAAAARRRMKAQENRLLGRLRRGSRFALK